MSRAVARLEARVGVRLFDRNPREVSLTEEGRRFHAQVMPLLAGLDEAAAEAAGAAAVVRGRLRVSVDPWFARMVLAPKLQRFLVRYPLLSVDFSTSNYREEMMTGVDVAVRFGPPDASSLIVRKLLETPILTVAAPAYLERHREPRSPHDLVHHEALLFRDPQTGLPFPWEFQRGGEVVEVKVSSRLVMDDPSVAISACWPVKAFSRASLSAWRPSCREANSFRSCRNGRKNFIRSMPIIPRAISRPRRSELFWISSRRLLSGRNGHSVLITKGRNQRTNFMEVYQVGTLFRVLSLCLNDKRVKSYLPG